MGDLTETVREAEALERQAIAAIGALGRREIDAVKAWIASGCDRARPRPDMVERERLARNLSAVFEARRAAELAAELAAGWRCGAGATNEAATRSPPP